jgi:hypothetical protein
MYMKTKKYRGGMFGNLGSTFTEEQKAAGKIHDDEINIRKQEILAVNTPASKFIVGCIANFNNSQQFVNQFNKSTRTDSSVCGSATCDERANVIKTTLEQLVEIANKPNGAHAFASLQTKDLAKGVASYLTMGSKLDQPSQSAPPAQQGVPPAQQGEQVPLPQPPKKTGFMGLWGGSRKQRRRSNRRR